MTTEPLTTDSEALEIPRTTAPEMGPDMDIQDHFNDIVKEAKESAKDLVEKLDAIAVSASSKIAAEVEERLQAQGSTDANPTSNQDLMSGINGAITGLGDRMEACFDKLIQSNAELSKRLILTVCQFENDPFFDRGPNLLQYRGEVGAAMYSFKQDEPYYFIGSLTSCNSLCKAIFSATGVNPKAVLMNSNHLVDSDSYCTKCNSHGCRFCEHKRFEIHYS